MLDLAAVNQSLRGFTLVRGLRFECDPDDFSCRLRLDLRRDDLARGPALAVVFRGVAGLRVDGFGGGLTQVMHLRVADIRAEQHDRLCFQVDDSENGSLYFRCLAIDLDPSHPAAGLGAVRPGEGAIESPVASAGKGG